MLTIGGRHLPALVDSGASENFIGGPLARSLALECLTIAQPTKVRAANGQFMECTSYVCAFAALGRLKFRVCLRVVDTAMSILL